MIQENTKVTLTYGQLKRLVKESSGDRFQALLDKPTTFDGKTDKHPIIGKVYYSKENKFAWKLVWNKARNEDRIHVFKPSIISVAGDKRFGWREYLISADLETMKEIGFKDYAWVNYLYGFIVLGFTVSLITILFETTGKNKGHRPSTFTKVLFSVSIALYVATYLLDYIRTGAFDKSGIFMIVVSIIIISNFIKRKE